MDEKHEGPKASGHYVIFKHYDDVSSSDASNKEVLTEIVSIGTIALKEGKHYDIKIGDKVILPVFFFSRGYRFKYKDESHLVLSSDHIMQFKLG